MKSFYSERLRVMELAGRGHRAGPTAPGFAKRTIAKIYSQAELDKAVSAAMSAAVRQKDEIIKNMTVLEGILHRYFIIIDPC